MRKYAWLRKWQSGYVESVVTRKGIVDSTSTPGTCEFELWLHGGKVYAIGLGPIGRKIIRVRISMGLL